MSDIRELYQEVIIDHGRHPRNFGDLPGCNHRKEGFNPLCGDKITIYLDIQDDIVKDVKFSGSGCAISTASASLMTQVIKGKTLAEIEDLGRIRYTTSHPVEFSDRLIDVYATTPKLVDHLHLPVQSGSDRILGLMKRGHTVLEYKAKIRKLRAIRPNISLSSDFIVGFPGETEQDFMNTMNLIQEINYDHSFSFVYSKRPGTPAANLEDDTPMDVKKHRLNILQSRILQQAHTISNAMLGTEQVILVEAIAKKASENDNNLTGRTENNRVVNFAGPADLIGQFVIVKITEVLPNCLRAQLIE